MTEKNEFDQYLQDVTTHLPQDVSGETIEAESSFNDNVNKSDAVASPNETTEKAVGSRTLDEALQKFNIKLPSKKVRLLDEYCNLLWTWNEKLNLTRHTTYDKFVSRDLVDSIHLAALLQKGEHVLDVGSGGGVPGLVVAILRPDVIVELCEATGKKAEALGKMIDELKLDVNVWYAKAQDLVNERPFHTLTIRAVDRMCKLLTMFRSSWNSFNRILMIKGPRWVDERGEARHYNLFNSLALRKVDEYIVSVDGEDFNSVILQVCQKKKLDDIKRRAAELTEGKPYPGGVEEIVVTDGSRLLSVQRRQSSDGRRVNSKRHSRAFISTKDNRTPSEPTANEARVYARRNGKPPRGWTGRKEEFRSESDDSRAKGGKRSTAKKDWRSGKNKSSNESNVHN